MHSRPNLTKNAIEVLKKRYLRRDNSGKVIETPEEMLWRVAKCVAKADLIYNPNVDWKSTAREFYQVMADLEFLPNSPTLMNAGTELGQLSACFVLPVEDSIDGIFRGVWYAAKVHRSGGGTGFNFSKLRPKGSIVRTTGGSASGPVSFMWMYNAATEVIKSGGMRRGANMGILRVDHPDIFDFIKCKEKEGQFSNFNISVAVTDRFMDAVEKGDSYSLIDSSTGEKVRDVDARKVFDLISEASWKSGEPGIIFLDRINECNPTPELGAIESTNPCGEQPLLPYESCNLGSINLAKMVENGKIKWRRLEEVVKIAIHFLDNVIDVNKYPLPETEQITKSNRKVGLGVMGFADMLILSRISYSSTEAIKIAREVMGFISSKAKDASAYLAEVRGPFPNFEKSIYADHSRSKMRNATVTTIAPTGTLSIIADCSSGIEPLFALSYSRFALNGRRLRGVNTLFKKVAKEEGFYSKSLIKKIAKKGNLKDLKDIPEHIRDIFVTALEIPMVQHIKIQAAFQEYVDNAVSKTVNLPYNATKKDVKEAFMLAYKLRCKGLTVYRYKSRREQALDIG